MCFLLNNKSAQSSFPCKATPVSYVGNASFPKNHFRQQQHKVFINGRHHHNIFYSNYCCLEIKLVLFKSFLHFHKFYQFHPKCIGHEVKVENGCQNRGSNVIHRNKLFCGRPIPQFADSLFAMMFVTSSPLAASVCLRPCSGTIMKHLLKTPCV